MDYKEDVRTFLKRDLGVFAARSGQHKADLVKGKVPQIDLKALKQTIELIMLRILPHVLLKQLGLVQKNQEKS